MRVNITWLFPELQSCCAAPWEGSQESPTEKLLQTGRDPNALLPAGAARREGRKTFQGKSANRDSKSRDYL